MFKSSKLSLDNVNKILETCIIFKLLYTELATNIEACEMGGVKIVMLQNDKNHS